MAFGKSASTKLRESADGFIDLCENPDKYLLGGRNRGRRKKKKEK